MPSSHPLYCTPIHKKKNKKSKIDGNIYNLKVIIQKCHYVEPGENVVSSISAVLYSWHFSLSLLQLIVTVIRFWSLNLFKGEKLLFHPILKAYNMIGKVSGIIRQLVDVNPRRNRAAFVLSSHQNLGNLAMGNVAGM